MEIGLKMKHKIVILQPQFSNTVSNTISKLHQFFLWYNTWRVELCGLCKCISGEKLVLTATLAPRRGRTRYGFGTPTPKTYHNKNKQELAKATG